MAAMRGGPRLAVGSSAWIAEERATSLQISQSEAEEFSFSARNEVEWLNEHMAEIFSENQVHVAELFKTPGKLRGKTPRTARKGRPGENRVPLSNIFSATPKGAPNPFARPNPIQAQTPKLKIAEDRAEHAKSKPTSPAKAPPVPPHQRPTVPVSALDSGYYGSQSQDVDYYRHDAGGGDQCNPQNTASVEVTDFAPNPALATQPEHASPTQASVEDTFESAKEEPTRYVTAHTTMKQATQAATTPEPITSPAGSRSQSPTRPAQTPSPKKLPTAELSPSKPSPAKTISSPGQQEAAAGTSEDGDDKVDAQMDEMRSSDGSSPIRPIVRKSSLNFASLPAREPLTSTKSLGPRTSRISHLDQTRTSYYQRHTGGKSLGVNAQLGASENDHDDDDDDDMDDHDDMDIDDDLTLRKDDIATHSKTYTQRLQDQISMLGKSQSNGPRPSKSFANVLPQQQQPQQQQQGLTQPPQQLQRKPAEPAIPSPTPKRKQHTATPGAFPEDDDDDWISPPTPTNQAAPTPRPTLPKGHSTDLMEGVHGKETVGGSEFVLPKSRPASPMKAPQIPERTTSVHGHAKAASVSYLPTDANDPFGVDPAAAKKGISVSNPSLNTVSEDDVVRTPSKSPSRHPRDSPLKQVKNKLSSILKSSKGLLASSAAISAEGKSSLISPSMTRLGFHVGQSTDSLRGAEQLYPDLTHPSPSRPETSSGNNTRRTRASTEREKREAKEKEKETKETKRLVEQMDKLEKIREKEREKARVFTKERERIAEMEKHIAEQKEQGMAPPAQETPVLAPRSPTKATRSSPRKTKAQPETETRAAKAGDDDVEMIEAPATNTGPPQRPRSAASSAPRGQAIKRPTKPTKEAPSKARQAPTVIRVNTTSAQQSQFHNPSNNVLAATLQETLGPQHQGPQRQLPSKASHASLQTKPSLQSLKSSVSSSGRPKALDLAAKRKEQEQRETKRKREAKQEMERKRAAAQEEERKQEQQRRQEMERQREEERKQAAAATQAKKDAQRQAAIDRAKQTRAPPPAARPQANVPAEYNLADKGPARPPSRLGSMIPQDGGRPVNALLSNASKMGPKRPLQQEANEESARPPVQRNGPSYQAKEVKRMRMSEEFDDDIAMADSQPHVIKGPPVRPSGGFKKELSTKSMFSNGYTPAHQGVSRDLFKATVTGQHSSHAKAAHPLDMAQLSKGAIPFAPNPNGAGPSHKTPARPAGGPGPKSVAKSTAKSSPRFQNGDAIELPEIETDDDDDDDDSHIGVAAWADSPDLRRALMRQETIDPSQIFGAPPPLNMEEVFSRSKDRFLKFRARTSSANWSGADRLTEEDIRKDLQARDRMRREGGWSYELNRDGLA